MNGNTPLHYAAEGGFADCCRYIGQRGTLKLSCFATIIYISVLKERFHLGISERFDSWVPCGTQEKNSHSEGPNRGFYLM